MADRGSVNKGSEIDGIRLKYEAGELVTIGEDLHRFIQAHVADICAYREEQARKGLALSDEAAIKFYILHHRSINPQREIRDQLEEIQKEKWIRGIQTGCEPDAQEVALDWARTYSADWRSHRVTAIIYVFEREKEKLCNLLKRDEASR